MLRVHRVGATLSLPPVGIENKSQNRSLGLDQQERYPGQLLAACSQTDGSPAEALPNQCAGWCCVDRLSWHALPDTEDRADFACSATACPTNTSVWIDTFVQLILCRASANVASHSHPLRRRRGVSNGRHEWTERDYARDRSCRLDHA